MNEIKKNLIVSLLFLLSIALISAPLAYAQSSIADIAVSDPDNFSILVTALQAAELVDVLNGTGPFTVFAPTDEAFEALPPGVLDQLLANTTVLTEVLTYHVVAGETMAANLTDGDTLTTLQGGNLTVNIDEGEVMINDAIVIIPDVEASNGVIHAINKVLIPLGFLDIVDTAINAESFSILVAALEVTGLNATLKSQGAFTVFAPTDEAFLELEAANPGIIEELLANPDKLANILTYHVVAGEYNSSEVLAQKCLLTVQGNFLTVETNDRVMIDGAEIIALDINSSNGIIHVIDAVMIPEKPPIQPIEDTGVALIYSRGYFISGEAQLEVYPFNSLNQPEENLNNETICAWVAKLTVNASGWMITSKDGNWRRVNGELEMFWIAKYWTQWNNNTYLLAKGYAWTFNGTTLSGKPSSIVIIAHDNEPLRVNAYSCGLKFYG